jgi:hypothetical protein
MTSTAAESASVPLNAKAQLLQQRRIQWQDMFTDRIYLVCNDMHPGIGLEEDAMKHISEILIRVLFEILEQKPETAKDVLGKIKTVFPSALTNFVLKHHETKGGLHNMSSKRLHQGRSKKARSLAVLHQKLHKAAKDHVGKKVEDNAILHLMSILEYILNDILTWAGTYVNKLLDNHSRITLPSLKLALNADGVSHC